MADQHETPKKEITIYVTGEDGRRRKFTFEAQHDSTLTMGEALEQIPGFRRINPPPTDEEYTGVTGAAFMAVPETPPHLGLSTDNTHAACPWCGNPITLSKG